MKYLKRKQEKGLVMLAILFLVAFSTSFLYAKTYFNLANQIQTAERQIQTEKLRFIAISSLGYAQKWVKEKVTGVPDGLSNMEWFNVGPIQQMHSVDSPENWLNASSGGIKSNYRQFAASLTGLPPLPTYAIDNIDFSPDCTADSDCFANVIQNNYNTTGTANIALKTKMLLKAGPDVNDIIFATKTMQQAILVSASNLAYYSVFTHQDLYLNPGPAFTLEGPVYVGGDAFVTPSKGSAITLTYDSNIVASYIAKIHGNFYWFGDRKLGNLSVSGPPSCTVGTPGCYPLPEWQLPAVAETDPNGEKVLYYFMSNIDFGWTDTNGTPGLQNDEKSTILITDLNHQTLPQDVELIGTTRPAPSLFYGPTPEFLGERWNSDGMWPVYTTTHLDWTQNLGTPNWIVKSTLSFKHSNPFDIETAPSFQNLWDQFLTTQFETSPGFRIFEDGAEEEVLVIGSADNPHALIDLAQPGDDLSLQDIKFQWLARNSSNGNPLQPTFNYGGISLDFNKYLCSSTDPNCDNPNTDPDNSTLYDRDPLRWAWHSGTAGPAADKFIYLVTRTSGDPTSTIYYDERRTKILTEIIIDVAQLKALLDSNTAGQQPYLPAANTPVLLYIGLPTVPINTIGPMGPERYGVNDSLIRLINAEELPNSGITVATNGFLQIQGNYNTECPAGSICDTGSANYQCEMIPAAVVADQIMVLSNSWQDFTYGSSWPNLPDCDDSGSADPDCSYSPASFQIPVDGPGGPFYNAPGNALGNPFSISDYKAHPIWAETMQADPASINVDVRSMILGGNVPNQLIPQTNLNPDVNSTFSWANGDITGIGLSNYTTSVFSGSTKTYISKEAVTNTLCRTGIDDKGNPIDRPANCPSEAVLVDPEYDDIPVYYVTYDPVTDVPTYHRATNPGGSPGTVGGLFGASNCPSCDDNIPIFVNVDENGQIMLGSGMENKHMKPYDAAHQTDADYLEANGRIKPGTRFAAVSQLNQYYSPNRVDGRSDLLNLFPDIPPCNAPTYCCTAGDTNCYQNGGAAQCALQTHSCETNPAGCPVGCENCLPNYGCNPGGEGGCSGQTAHCINSNGGVNCGTNFCDSPCLWVCAGSNGGISYPTERRVVYTVGGRPRLWLSGSQGNTYWRGLKSQYMYVPYYKAKYSGGLENFIRFGEDWDRWDCNFGANPVGCTKLTDGSKVQFKLSGTMDILWTAETLVMSDGTPAFWTPTTYSAPERVFHYLSSLRTPACIPPGIPGTASVRTQGFSED